MNKFSPISSYVTLYCVVLLVCLPDIVMCLLFRACELTLLRPLWRLFMSMENSLNQDPTSITVLLPLHRALSELFFIAEARAVVSGSCTQTHTPSMQTTSVKVEQLIWAVAPCRGLYSFMSFLNFSLLCWQHCWLILYIHILFCNHWNNMNPINSMNNLFNFSFSIIVSRWSWESVFFYTTQLFCSEFGPKQALPSARLCHAGSLLGEVPFLPLLFWMINQEKSAITNMTSVRNSSSVDAIEPKGARKDYF